MAALKAEHGLDAFDDDAAPPAATAAGAQKMRKTTRVIGFGDTHVSVRMVTVQADALAAHLRALGVDSRLVNVHATVVTAKLRPADVAALDLSLLNSADIEIARTNAGLKQSEGDRAHYADIVKGLTCGGHIIDGVREARLG